MKSKIKIQNPCSEIWETMTDIPEGKFCEICSKKVWDFTEKSSEEIENILLENPKLCGRINQTKLNIASSILIAVSLTVISCSNQTVVNNNSIENIVDKKVKINGKIKVSSLQILNSTKVQLLTKNRLYKGIIDDNFNFEIEIPESELRDRNIIKIDYDIVSKNNPNEKFKDYSLHILNKNESFSHKVFVADNDMYEIGAVVITSPEPPDFYYFDGKRISKNKFEKIKKENPNYDYIYLDEEVLTDIITKNAYVGTVYLLYSK